MSNYLTPTGRIFGITVFLVKRRFYVSSFHLQHLFHIQDIQMHDQNTIDFLFNPQPLKRDIQQIMGSKEG